MQGILEQCEQIRPEFMRLWEKLVNIDSGSDYSPGLRQVAEIVGEFCARQGMEITYHPVAAADGKCNVTARAAGTGTKSILLLAHMDTVFPVGTAAARPFRTDAEYAYGPGVSDCKGGVVLALYTMHILKKMNNSSYRHVTCCFNCDEEISSPDSRDLIMELAKRHDYVLCLEPGQANDGVIAWRKGVAKLKVTVAGKASHSGSDPDKGCNALLELSHQINRISMLANRDKETTVTFTKMAAGDRLNVVPDYAEAWADVRAVYAEELDRIEREAQALAASATVAGTRTAVELRRGRPPFFPNEGTQQLIDKAKKIYAELGRSLSQSGAGGGADANLAAAAGAIVLDSLGPVKGGPNHTADEKARLDSLAPRLYLLVRLITALGGEAAI
ncbi:glutamate carboxypeptidase [Acetonema longum]|uniref:Glutamate carboxypeptidase n=1 Tax=Acetonema longum DSM 6540 TaxID=1009370 RepID=F7NFT6_9FIRM|nr:glutamate carboxypeptidase [Acetonema longum]EGO65097.1 glutamate carboxypeptidase [Acetonema longum DSM 6540]